MEEAELPDFCRVVVLLTQDMDELFPELHVLAQVKDLIKIKTLGRDEPVLCLDEFQNLLRSSNLD